MNKNLLNRLPKPEGMSKSEIIQILLSEEYGFLPGPPEKVSAKEESAEEQFCAGKAVLKKLLLTCRAEYGDFTFPVYFIYPTKREKPVPCFVHINFRDLIPDRYLPIEEIIDSGYAVLYFCYQDVTSDDGDFTNGLAGLIYPEGKRTKTQCGKIGLWAWAAGRVMDHAMTVPILDHGKISIVGHSRLGKTALLAGALDERFYCAFSNDSGCSGAAISREKRGETIQRIFQVFPYWFCENYGKYAENVEELPFDQHFLLAANAPHRVYVASASEDSWADPEHEYLSCVAADQYYKSCGLKGFVHPDRDPVPGDFFGEGEIGYHLRAGTHYLSREDWQRYIQYLNLADGN